MAMTKIDIVDRVHTQLGMNIKESADMVDTVFSLLKDTLASGTTLKISGFGTFTVKQKADRRGRNPQTGEAITICSRKILSYKVSNKLKDAINGSANV